MTKPDVAIAIVTYKSADLAIDCIRSIHSERLSSAFAIRVLVVDNFSGDGPKVEQAIIENDWSSWVHLVVSTRNGGFAYGNNVAICEAARVGPPRYLHLLNPDTVLRRGAIDALVSFLDHNPAVGIAGSSFENLDGSEWPIAFRFPTLLGEVESALRLGIATRLLNRWVVPKKMSQVAQPIDWVPGASMMVRWGVIDAIGGLDDQYFLYFEETDYCYRAKKAGFPTWYVPASRVMHIAGQSTKVTERQAKPKRLPRYWYESRRRFFAKSYGIYYAIATDLAALVAYGLGITKMAILCRIDEVTPHFARDLLKHSLLWPKNRIAAASESPLDVGSTKSANHN